eukprot:TRINITY_DN5007_c0_g2_i1.p1 TRINITY_DN5007_c0_g2~~TRINITY_DN5007_c0_g2_i1.p1  ORF type:complete len:239 (-),score=17.96 TRINITY_DN5007_c0_g2_i1:523-1152(-)
MMNQLSTLTCRNSYSKPILKRSQQVLSRVPAVNNSQKLQDDFFLTDAQRRLPFDFQNESAQTETEDVNRTTIDSPETLEERDLVDEQVLSSVQSLQSTALEILERQLNGNRGELAQWFTPTSMAWFALFVMLQQNYPANAQGGIGDVLEGITPQQIFLALAPIISYAIFVIYRTSFNPKAKLSTYLLTIGAIVIIGNVLSTIIFKVRLF